MTSPSKFASEAAASIYDQDSDVYYDLHYREIRLVRLLRGQWSDKIRCQLKHAYLANQPIYKALSYAWGSPRATRPILVDDFKHQVTVNLESALRRLRQVDADIDIWADALSINQSKISERTEQVKLMHDIYSSANEVVVYLGELPTLHFTTVDSPKSTSATVFQLDDEDHSKLALFQSRCSGDRCHRKRIRIDLAVEIFCVLRSLADKSAPDTLSGFDINTESCIESKYQRKLFEGLRQMMRCRWWKRIWVIQEMVVPKKVTMVYGSAVAPWEMFVEAANWESRNQASLSPLTFLPEYSTVLAYFSRIVLDLEGMRSMWADYIEWGTLSHEPTRLLLLLRRFSDRKASDDRDKVYALLGLARNQTSILPDYSLSVPEVFQATTLDIITRTGSLMVFTGDIGRKDRQDLPSWVPDWSATYDDLDRRRADNTEIYKAAGETQLGVRVGGNRVLLFEEDLDVPDPSEQEILDYNIVGAMINRIGNFGWLEWLPEDVLQSHDLPSRVQCNLAVNDYYTACGGGEVLQLHSEGVIQIPYLFHDEIVVTGDMTFSESTVRSVVHSWAELAWNHFVKSQENPYIKDPEGLENAFRRTICADIVSSNSPVRETETRLLKAEEICLINRWAIGDTDTQQNHEPWMQLFGSHSSSESDAAPNLSVPTSPILESAIIMATVRRTFFITRMGYIGLGPAKTQHGDELYILRGGKTPFVLRKAGSRKVIRTTQCIGDFDRPCYEVVGDCYAHGLMDGGPFELGPQDGFFCGSKHGDVTHDVTPTSSFKEDLAQYRIAFADWHSHKHSLNHWQTILDSDSRNSQKICTTKDFEQLRFDMEKEKISTRPLEELLKSAKIDIDELESSETSLESQDPLPLKMSREQEKQFASLRVKVFSLMIYNNEQEMRRIQSISHPETYQCQVYLI